MNPKVRDGRPVSSEDKSVSIVPDTNDVLGEVYN